MSGAPSPEMVEAVRDGLFGASTFLVAGGILRCVAALIDEGEGGPRAGVIELGPGFLSGIAGVLLMSAQSAAAEWAAAAASSRTSGALSPGFFRWGGAALFALSFAALVLAAFWLPRYRRAMRANEQRSREAYAQKVRDFGPRPPRGSVAVLLWRSVVGPNRAEAFGKWWNTPVWGTGRPPSEREDASGEKGGEPR